MNFIEELIEQGSNQEPLQLLLNGVHNWKSVFPSKRKEPIWKDWAQLIKDQVGAQRVSLKRFEEFIKGTGLYVEDNYLRYKETFEDLDNNLDNIETEEQVPVKQVIEDEDPYVPLSVIEGPIGPKMLPCGHNGWFTQEKDEEAQAEGYCCAGGKHKHMVFWNVRGLIHPIPEKLRKENIKFNPEGSGYCAHPDTGLYIGGILNNCIYNKGDVRCKFHQQ